MPEEWLRRSPKKRRELAAEAVYSLLPIDKSEVGWSELKMKAEKKGLSSATLRAHLKSLVYLGLAHRRVGNSTYPPRVYYSRVDPYLFPMKFGEQARLYAELDLVGEIADKGKFKPGTEGFYEQAVNVNLLFMKAALPTILYSSMGGKGPYTIEEPEKMSGEDWDKYYEQIHRDIHDLADELLDVVLRPWVHKMLDVLEIFSSDNKGVLEAAAAPELMEAASALKRYDELFEPYRKR
jgi:DNA-binding transcriptional ArsR family regulator